MSTIGRFLQAKEPLFDHALHQLELQSHQKGVDVKLAAEIAQTAANRPKRLALTTDAPGPELYDTLIKQVDAGLLTHDEARRILNLPPLTAAQKAAMQPAPVTPQEAIA